MRHWATFNGQAAQQPLQQQAKKSWWLLWLLMSFLLMQHCINFQFLQTVFNYRYMWNNDKLRPMLCDQCCHVEHNIAYRALFNTIGCPKWALATIGAYIWLFLEWLVAALEHWATHTWATFHMLTPWRQLYGKKSRQSQLWLLDGKSITVEELQIKPITT